MTQKTSENEEAILLSVFFKFYFRSQNSENNRTNILLQESNFKFSVCIDAQGNEIEAKGNQ